MKTMTAILYVTEVIAEKDMEIGGTKTPIWRVRAEDHLGWNTGATFLATEQPEIGDVVEVAVTI